MNRMRATPLAPVAEVFGQLAPADALQAVVEWFKRARAACGTSRRRPKLTVVFIAHQNGLLAEVIEVTRKRYRKSGSIRHNRP